MHFISYLVPSNLRMKRFDYTTAEDLGETRFGFYLLDLLKRLKLPIPKIKGCILKKLHREGLWGIKAVQLGREGEKTMEIKVVSDTMEKGLNVIIQDLIGRLCGRYYQELGGHYSILFGRRDEEGEPYDFDTKDRGKAESLGKYCQDLEHLVHELFHDNYEELYKNDELCAQVQENEEKVKEQEERLKALEEKFQEQEKKYKNQEKRVQKKNKEMKEMKMELESNEVELEADFDLIKRLRAEKKELQEKNLELTKEVKELRSVLDQEGFEIQEVEEEEEDDSMVVG